jgi:outer membrane protein OmpA-like peptidoglycan-associated protein
MPRQDNPFDRPVTSEEMAASPGELIVPAPAKKQPEKADIPPPPPAPAEPPQQSAPPAVAAEEAPQKEPAQKEKQAEKEVASLPPAETAAPASEEKPDLRLPFRTTETTVPLSMQPDLDKVAATLMRDKALRVVIVAYASGSADQPSTARRISLSRALAIRAYLIDHGVENLRINVRAEGSKDAGKQADRVDLFIKQPGEMQEG